MKFVGLLLALFLLSSQTSELVTGTTFVCAMREAADVIADTQNSLAFQSQAERMKSLGVCDYGTITGINAGEYRRFLTGTTLMSWTRIKVGTTEVYALKILAEHVYNA